MNEIVKLWKLSLKKARVLIFSAKRKEREKIQKRRTIFQSVALAYWRTRAMSQFVNVEKRKENLFDPNSNLEYN